MNDRQLVSRLIMLVITGQIPVRQALLSFPKNTTDKSIITAYHALIHYEADDDLRTRDAVYREEQDDYLELLAHILENGEDLPDNVIENYKKYYKSANIQNGNDARGLIKSFLRFLS